MGGFSINRQTSFADFRGPDGLVAETIPTRVDTMMEFRGLPVTIEEFAHKDARQISIWMPGEARRTPALLQQEFTAQQWWEFTKIAMASHDGRGPMANLGMREVTIVHWCESNYREILKAQDKREREHFATGGFFDPYGDPSDPVETEFVTLPDGRRCIKRKPNKKAQERRVLAEMEDTIPGFGSF